MAELLHQSTRVPFLGSAGAITASKSGVNGPDSCRLAPRGLLCEKPRCNARRKGFHSKFRLDDKVRGAAGLSRLSQVHGRRLVYPTRPGSLLAFCSSVLSTSQGFSGVDRSSKRCSYFPFQRVASTSSRLGLLSDSPGFPQPQDGRQVTKSRKRQKPLLLLESNITSSFGRLRSQSRRRKVNSRRLVRTLDSLETGGRSERAESSQHRLPGSSSSIGIVDNIAALDAEIGSRISRANSDATTSESRILHNVPPPSVSSTSGGSSIVGLSSKRGEELALSIAEVSGQNEAPIEAETVGSSNTSTVGESGSIDRARESVCVDTAADACTTSLTEHREKYWKGLIDTENWEALHLDRAGSVTDAHVLRRKGHLKEQDGLIDFIISMHQTLSPFEVMEKMEQWILEHMQDPKRSALKRLVPSVGGFYTHLKLVDALREYDEFASLSRRRYVPPNFAEIRHILNIAQLHASAEGLALITFDADGTLYADGHHMKDDNKMIGHIIALMKRGVSVAIVTAAGYPGDAARFEGRLAGLLAAFEALQLPPATTKLFHVMGGECNYLLAVNEQYRLEFVDDALWKLDNMLEWREEEVTELLDDAEAILRSASARLRVPVEIIRKERSVGICPVQPTIYEVLEEVALTVQAQLVDSKLPFCAFNGGKDVFVDIGNKSLGLAALMQYLQKKPRETLHVGDRFTVTGNDGATRSRCSILWVANPEETSFFTRMLLRDIHLSKLTPYLE